MRDVGENLLEWLRDEAALQQKISRCLLTAKGSMLLNRDFGSGIRRHMDKSPVAAQTEITGDIFENLSVWIPQYQPKSARFNEPTATGKLKIRIKGTWDREEITSEL